MNTSYSLWRSRTFWTGMAMFVVGGGNAIIPVIPTNVQVVVMFLLGVIASYFHLKTGESTMGSN